VLGFLILLMDYNLKDNKFKSAFVSAVAVFSIDVNCRWKNVLGFMLIILVVIIVVRMLVLY